jgi:CHRD domain
MKKLLFVLAIVCCSSLASIASDDTVTLRASLRGDNEVPPINTPATGDFKATQNADGTFSFTLTFANLKAPLILAHFHFAPKHVGGAVMIFLCGGDSQPACPSATSGTITGTFGPTNVVCTGCTAQNPAGQGIKAGDFAGALEAILEGNSYVNIHSAAPDGFPGGEARGQVSVSRGDGDRD